MTYRQTTAAIGIVLLALGTAPAGATQPPRGVKPPSLEGLWTNASYTRLQRPKQLKSLVISPDEARLFEATLTRYHGLAAFKDDSVGQLDSEFNDSGNGLAHIHGEIRTSWIVDPADGRLPYTPKARAILDAPDSFDNPEDLGASGRCLNGNGSGPPQLSAMDTNLVQIVQTKDHLVLLSEKNHDVRIIPLDRPADPDAPPTWGGNSVGHWVGKTLVVQTTGFLAPIVDRFFVIYSNAAKIEEHFTRTSPTEILYTFTVNDPSMFTQPWRAEMVFSLTKGPMYEFACHEGNYALPSMLRAARMGRQDPPHPVTPPPPAAK